jgi:hypothetical protein
MGVVGLKTPTTCSSIVTRPVLRAVFPVSIFANILAATRSTPDISEMLHVFESKNQQSTFATHYPISIQFS